MRKFSSPVPSLMHLSSEPYKLSFTTGGLFVLESAEIAVLRLEARSWKHVREDIAGKDLLTLPKAVSKQRSLREILFRLERLTDEELRFLAESDDPLDRNAVCWLAVCRSYRLIEEFILEVVQERFISYRMELPPWTFDSFFEQKCEWDERLAQTRASTRRKLQQVLFRMMREAKLLDDKNNIQAPFLSESFKRLIVGNREYDLRYFPGQSVGGSL